MKQQTRHEQLLAAGWQYDPAQDRYRAPNTPDDGTATLYNLEAAWQHYTASQIDSANTPLPPPKDARKVDPRRQEPE